MPKYYRVPELCAFTGLLTVCQPVMLPERIQMWSWWLLCREWGHDLCCCSMVPSLICLYRRMENTDDSVPFLPKYAYVYTSSYQPLLRSSDICWRIELTCPNLRTTCPYCVRLSTVLSKSHRSNGAKLYSAVSSNFKRFHIYKKHKLIFGSHWISADENVRLSHTRPHTLWR
jgi:hypothetical protein